MIRYHTSCATISIYSFDKISETNDLKHMVVGWDEYEEINIDQEKADELWKEIFNEYIILSNDNKISMYYETVQELSYLKSRRYVVSKLLNRIISVEDKEMRDKYILELRQWKFVIDKNKPFKDEIKKMFNQLKATKNKIYLTEDKLKTLRENDVHTTLTEQVVKLEDATGRTLIDPKTTSVEKWLMIIKNVPKHKKSA